MSHFKLTSIFSGEVKSRQLKADRYAFEIALSDEIDDAQYVVSVLRFYRGSKIIFEICDEYVVSIEKISKPNNVQPVVVNVSNFDKDDFYLVNRCVNCESVTGKRS